MNIPYERAGWINNMNARDTYEHIYHLRRLLYWALETDDMKLADAACSMLQSWWVNEEVISRKVLDTVCAKG